jgi:cysteine synthase A
MQTNEGIVGAIGNTPLIALKRASDATQCTILGKAEFMNPGQSVKDRPARQIILEAEQRGEIRPGGLVVEATAGNTGIGLALVANARGYRTLIVIPDTQSQEKKDMLRLCGAELIEVPAVPYSNPNNYQHIGRRLVEQLRKNEPNGVLFADQWNNLDNRKAHYVSTGPEIWQQTGGKVDGFICAIGTGGTVAGVATYLRERKKDVVIGVADPRGAAMYNLFAHGEAKASDGGSITEGIGLGRVTSIIADIKVDKAYLIPDEEAVPVIFDLLEHEGLQRRGRDPACQGHGAGPHHRHHSRRLRLALSVEAVQSRVPAHERPAGAGMAGTPLEREGAVRLEHDPEKACPGRDPGWVPVFGKDHAPAIS